MVGYRIGNKYIGASRFILQNNTLERKNSPIRSKDTLGSMIDSSDDILTYSEVRYYRENRASDSESYMAHT